MSLHHFATPLLAAALLAATSNTARADANIAVTGGSVQAGIKPTTLPFTVQRSGDLGFAVEVSYSTQDGTAKAGRDYTATSGSVVIPAGKTSATVSVPVARKLLRSGGGKDFSLALSTATPVAGLNFSTAAQVPVDRYSAGMAVADFNADGKLDAVVSSLVSGFTYVLRNDTVTGSAVGTFNVGAAIAPLITGPSRVGVVDFNRDGKPDVVVTSMDTNRLTVLINTTPDAASNFSFVASLVQLPDYGWANDVAFGDFNGDGIVDMVLSNPGSSVQAGTDRVLIFANTTPVGATVPVLKLLTALPTGPNGTGISASAVRVLDVNGDGKLDIAVGGFSGSRVGVAINTTPVGASAPTFGAVTTFATKDGVTSLKVADFNGDGKPDLVTANIGTSQLGTTWTVLLNTTTAGATTASFAVADQNGGAPTGVAVADLDGDGKPDVLVANVLIDDTGAGGIDVYLNRMATGSTTPNFQKFGTYPAGDEPHALAVGDFNRDGLIDLITNDSVSNLASIAFLQPLGVTGKVVITTGTAVGTIALPAKP